MRADIEIGYRAAQEVRRLFPSNKRAVTALGCSKNTPYEWSCGASPSALNLARLLENGADVYWILTGRRAK